MKRSTDSSLHSLPEVQQQGRQTGEEGLSAWAQAPSPFNTPPNTGDSVESISDLWGLTMPIATRTGENFSFNHLQQYQARPNQENFSWNQNSSTFDNTPPPQGDSFDNNITGLLSLDMPRGSLLGNSNPIGTNAYSVTGPFDNSSFQGQQGLKFACYQTRFEPPTISTPRKSRPQDLTPTSPFSQVSPICPPQQISSPPYSSGRNSSDDNSLYHSPTQRQNDVIKPNADHSNAVQNLSAMFCPSTEQELNNIQNLFAIRKESDLVSRIIEHTSRLLLAAVNSPEAKSNEPPQFPLPNNLQEKAGVSRYQQRGGNDISQRGNACTWSGNLPPRIHNNPTYSCKVFLGGVPWDITEMTLIQAFSRFGSIKIEWPGKDMPNQANQPKGYAYIIFETEKKVKALLDCCIHDFSKGGNWYYRLSSRKLKSKEVQVIPWAVSDSNYAQVSQKLDPQKTVFVGALHGMINAKALAKIMNDLFGGVIYAGLDTDKYKYPIGSARVTFNNHRSYMKAILAAFIDIKTSQFSKKVQVNPYLEDSPCSLCSIQHGPYFCREISCFSYYCRNCWTHHHNTELLMSHTPLTRNSKNSKITTVAVVHNSIQMHNAL